MLFLPSSLSASLLFAPKSVSQEQANSEKVQSRFRRVVVCWIWQTRMLKQLLINNSNCNFVTNLFAVLELLSFSVSSPVHTPIQTPSVRIYQSTANNALLSPPPQWNPIEMEMVLRIGECPPSQWRWMRPRRREQRFYSITQIEPCNHFGWSPSSPSHFNCRPQSMAQCQRQMDQSFCTIPLPFVRWNMNY